MLKIIIWKIVTLRFNPKIVKGVYIQDIASNLIPEKVIKIVEYI